VLQGFDAGGDSREKKQKPLIKENGQQDKDGNDLGGIGREDDTGKVGFDKEWPIEVGAEETGDHSGNDQAEWDPEEPCQQVFPESLQRPDLPPGHHPKEGIEEKKEEKIVKGSGVFWEGVFQGPDNEE